MHHTVLQPAAALQLAIILFHNVCVGVCMCVHVWEMIITEHFFVLFLRVKLHLMWRTRVLYLY